MKKSINIVNIWTVKAIWYRNVTGIANSWRNCLQHSAGAQQFICIPSNAVLKLNIKCYFEWFDKYCEQQSWAPKKQLTKRNANFENNLLK